MAGKSPTELFELIMQLHRELAVLGSKTAGIEKAVDQSDYSAVLQRLAVIEDRVAELKKTREDGDRWFKQLLLIVIGAALAFLASVVVNVVLFAKK